MVLAFASLILVLASPLSFGAKRLGQLRQQYSEMSRKINQVQWKLRQVKRTQRTEAERLHDSERRLNYSRSNLRDVQSQLRATRVKLTRTQAELTSIEKRLKKQNDLMASRLASNYRHGNAGYLNVLFGAADFSDLLSRSYVVRNIVDKDADEMNEFKADREAAREHKAELEVQEEKRAQLEEEQSALVRQIAEETQVHAEALQEVNQERARYEGMLDDLEAASKQVEAMIQRMERTPQGRKRLMQVWHGSFMKPVSGDISCPFGWRSDPFTHTRRFHTGVDIRCPIGTPIHAAADGVVIVAGHGGAYGNYVIIDHGGGMSTLYGHQSRLVVRNGETVKQGQLIGYSGSTGRSTGPHCHFQVMRHGVPVNPL
jgi:murein DD-endopeptidase MepM/ murein hydrolase activator NlpD